MSQIINDARGILRRVITFSVLLVIFGFTLDLFVGFGSLDALSVSINPMTALFAKIGSFGFGLTALLVSLVLLLASTYLAPLFARAMANEQARID